jgi:hypothetical protein
VKDGTLNGTEFTISERFSIDLIPSSNVYQFHFVLGGFADGDGGGWLIPDLERNINICLKDKERKIAPVRSKYPEWWLILLDHVGYCMESGITVVHGWDKLILVNPMNPKVGIEIPGKSNLGCPL